MLGYDEKTRMELEFLDEIIRHPRDQFALSVYADWLMDQPGPAEQTRGEYLRLECWLAGQVPFRDRRDLHWQQHSLWWNHVETWLGPLYDAVDHFIYERGQLCLEISEPTFCAADPVRLAVCPAWNWVTDIVVREGGIGLVRRLMSLPRPVYLPELNVGPFTLKEGELAELVAEGLWEGLTEMDLHANDVSDRDVRALAYWPGVRSLRKLDLRDTPVGLQGAESLAGSPFLAGLELLDLRNTPVNQFSGEELPRFRSRVLLGYA